MKLRRSIATIVSVATLVLGGFVSIAGAAQPASANSDNSTVVAHTSATDSYTCPSGGVLSGTTCQLSVTTPATPVPPSYTCSAGDTLSGETCTATISTPAIPGAPAYACNAGDTLNGEACTTTTSTSATETQTGSTPVYEYTCSSGTLSGTECDSSYPDELGQAPYTCSSGWTLVGATCQRTFSSSSATCLADDGSYSGGECTTYIATGGGQLEATCPDGGSYDGVSSCDVSTPASYTLVGDDPTYGYTCSSGTLSGETCVSTSTYAATSSPTYSCSIGTLSGSECQTESTYPATMSPPYVCSSGTLSGSTCTTTTTYAATATLTCPSGQELDGTNCITPITPVPPSSGTPPPSTVSTYTAIAISTDGLSFSGSSTTSQVDAQTAANNAATAYDATHPVEITVVPKSASLTANVKIIQAPMSDPGIVKATLYGPVPVNARSCKSVSVKRYSAAKKTSRTVAVSGSGTHAMLAPRKVSGCYAWSGTVFYDGGFTANTAISSKSAVYVTARK